MSVIFHSARQFYFKNSRNIYNMTFVYVNNRQIPFNESISLNFSDSCENQIQILSRQKIIDISSKMEVDFSSIPLGRPRSCPFATMAKTGLTDDATMTSTKHAWVSAACVVLLESSDNKVLLTRRASHMRTFPNVWVPPGGHVDADESLEAAALRELVEETGVALDSAEREGLEAVCSWESAYPTSLEIGPPVGHHLVVYFLAQVNATAVELGVLKVDPAEVDAYCWLDCAQVADVVRSYGDPLPGGSAWLNKWSVPDSDLFHCVELRAGQAVANARALSCLTVAVVETQPDRYKLQERVSTGTKYALSHWLRRRCDFVP